MLKLCLPSLVEDVPLTQAQKDQIVQAKWNNEETSNDATIFSNVDRLSTYLKKEV